MTVFRLSVVLRCVQKFGIAVFADFQCSLDGIWQSAEPTPAPNSSFSTLKVASLCRNIALRYLRAFYGPVTVSQERDTLGVTLGSIECALDHWDGDTFTYVPPGENGGIRGGITFGASADRIVDLRDTHLFEPYPLGEAPPDDTADT